MLGTWVLGLTGSPLSQLITLLWRLGWFPVRAVCPALADLGPGELETALMAYQGFHGQPVTGKPCDSTVRSLCHPRICSHPDYLPMATELNRWPTNKLKWTLTNFPEAKLDRPTTLEAINWGWQQWERVCDLEVSYTDNLAEAQVICAFGDIDGPARVLAFSELPDGTPGVRHLKFDAAEAWCVTETPLVGQVDLARVAAHEIGHMLGIGHLVAGCLMAPVYSYTIRSPCPPDITEAVARYGKRLSDPAPASGWSVTLSGYGPPPQVAGTGVRVIPN